MKTSNQLYYRTKDNGALVFRVDTENRQNRMDLVHIANVNLKKSSIIPKDDTAPSDAETAQIEKWITARRKSMHARQLDDVHRMMDSMNETAQWLQTKATSDELDAIADQLLLTMHDLRSTIVRKKSDFLSKNT